MSNSTELMVSIDKENALEVYSKPNGLDPYIEQIREEVESFVPDMTTESGRKEIASIAYKVAKSKTYLDNLGKSLTDDWAKKKKAVDSERKRVREELDALKDQVRLPLTDWENAEKERVSRLQGVMTWLDDQRNTQYNFGYEPGSKELQGVIDEVEHVVIDSSFAEFMAVATSVKEKTLDILNARKLQAEQREAEALELEQLRKSQEEQRRKDEIAEAVQLATESKEAEKARLKAEDEKKKLNLDNQKNIHRLIIAELSVIDISEQQSKDLITAIRRGGVTKLAILY